MLGFCQGFRYIVAMTGKIQRLEKLARDEVEAIVAALPAPLAERARQVPVIFEERPDPDDGQEDDLLGLFIGAELACEGDEPMPPQIILFLENLWDEAISDPAFAKATAGEKESAFRNEVRIT